MAKKLLSVWCGLLLVSVALISCSQQSGAEPVKAPPAPKMPQGWTVTADVSFPPDEVRRIGSNLGGELVALRNTDYQVNGKKVRVNTIVATNAANAKKVMEQLKKLKPADFLHQDDLIIYEFVGTNDAIPEMQAGKAHLAKS